jgi:transposase-like protein
LKKAGCGNQKGYRVRIWFPEINGDRIQSAEHLEEIIACAALGFNSRSDAARLVTQALIHLRIIQELENTEFLPRGKIASLSRQTEVSPTTLKRWLLQGAKPRLYYWLGMSPPHERKEKVRRLLLRLNGVTSIEEVDYRFDNLYFGVEMRCTTSHRMNRTYSEKFFRFLERYPTGGLINDIAREFGIGKSTIAAWLNISQLPTEVKYASLIPRGAPAEGWKWLPLRLNSRLNIPERFIQVPIEISSPSDIHRVLEQIRPLRTSQKIEHEKQIRKVSDHVSFMYLLGLIVADGSFDSDTDWSSRVTLYASKKYPWSLRIGDGFCYTMGRIGISVGRRKDSVRTRKCRIRSCRVWASEASPLIMWVKKTLLGLGTSSVKKEEEIRAEWILSMPREWRVGFIQGLADGDGYASIRSMSAGIATVTNQKFYARIFASLGIEAAIESNRVKIRKHNEILKARELSLFMQASGRQRKLDDLCDIIRILDRSHCRVPDDEAKLVLYLHSLGHSCGEVSEILWYDYDIARSPRSIERIVHRSHRSARRLLL